MAPPVCKRVYLDTISTHTHRCPNSRATRSCRSLGAQTIAKPSAQLSRHVMPNAQKRAPPQQPLHPSSRRPLNVRAITQDPRKAARLRSVYDTRSRAHVSIWARVMELFLIFARTPPSRAAQVGCGGRRCLISIYRLRGDSTASTDSSSVRPRPAAGSGRSPARSSLTSFFES